MGCSCPVLAAGEGEEDVLERAGLHPDAGQVLLRGQRSEHGDGLAGAQDDASGILDHLDATVLCEAPRIGPHREAMRARIAEIAGICIGQVSIKATTTEQLGFVVRREGIAAQAAATVRVPVSPA